MTYTATMNGEYPTGLHWTDGEARELPAGTEADAPGWLTPTMPPEPAAEPVSAPEPAPEVAPE